MSNRDIESAWPRGGSRPVRRLYGEDGELALLVEHDEVAGYLITSPAYGSHHISSDGSLVRCAPPSLARDDWHQLLVGQVLPVAATLRGLEVFHASALSFENTLVAIAAPSGGGKSTFGAALLREGASFVTDDVLALEQRGEGVVAHAGPGVLKLLMGVAGSVDTSTGAKARVEVARDERSLPLGAVYFLERARAGAELTVEPISETGAARLLASTYNLSVRTPERLRRQLEICARVARSASLFALRVPLGDVRQQARLLADHARSVLLTAV